MVRQHHQLNGHEFEQTPGDTGGQKSMVCYSPWRFKDLEEKGVAEDEMVRQHHQLNEHEFEHTPGHTGGQRKLVCYSPWVAKSKDMTQRLNNEYLDNK